jgi:hypothetical protein
MSRPIEDPAVITYEYRLKGFDPPRTVIVRIPCPRAQHPSIGFVTPNAADPGVEATPGYRRLVAELGPKGAGEHAKGLLQNSSRHDLGSRGEREARSKASALGQD